LFVLALVSKEGVQTITHRDGDRNATAR
jgi:hypothetical protein